MKVKFLYFYEIIPEIFYKQWLSIGPLVEKFIDN